MNQEAVSGQDQTPESRLLSAAERQVRLVRRALRVYWYVLAAVVLVVALLGFAFWQVHEAQRSSCLSGNTYRAKDYQTWQHFITLLTAGNDDPAVAAKATSYLAYVNGLDTPRDC